jgi:hypothetical protein
MGSNVEMCGAATIYCTKASLTCQEQHSKTLLGNNPIEKVCEENLLSLNGK